ncbi:MAG TPA: GntR family transcriptional regulator [Burkholderiales bacterium]|nr:GntR family transcriptional regulator [Burkholderiales bacterium]
MINLMRASALSLVESGPSSLHADIVSQLRDFIVEGHLLPGVRVPERELCEKFEISRTPLREALKVLAAEGLIELLPNRGARVRQFSEADIRDLFEVISGLDFVAGRMACARITDAEIAEIEALHLEMYTHYLRRELPDYFRLNQKIHQAIVDAAGNRLLSSNYANLNAVVRRLRYSANLVSRDRLGDAMREHEQIVDTLRRRAADELGLLMFQHMQSKCDAVCEYLRDRKLNDSPPDAAAEAVTF